MNEKIERPKHLDDWANPDHYFSEACLKASMYAIALEQQLAAETVRADQHLATVGELRLKLDKVESLLADKPRTTQEVANGRNGLMGDINAARNGLAPPLTADDVTIIVHNILRQRDANDAAKQALCRAATSGG